MIFLLNDNLKQYINMINDNKLYNNYNYTNDYINFLVCFNSKYLFLYFR